jgi:hypothetical protein
LETGASGGIPQMWIKRATDYNSRENPELNPASKGIDMRRSLCSRPVMRGGIYLSTN